MKRWLLMLGVLSVTACGSKVLMIGEAYPPTNAQDIKMYNLSKPICKFEEIAIIRTYWGFDSVANYNMKKAAADLGADGIIVGQRSKTDDGTLIVESSAIKCIE